MTSPTMDQIGKGKIRTWQSDCSKVPVQCGTVNSCGVGIAICLQLCNKNQD